jgi:fumarylpyruvate hydrolase
MSFIFPPKATSAVSIKDSDQLYPVNRIYCVGQNYGDHVREMGGDPKKNSPVFFSKPANAIVVNNKSVKYPTATDNFHYEVELVVALSSGGVNIPEELALNCVFGYAVGIDFTRRDLQNFAKKAGRPWDVAKGFDQSAPISSITVKSEITDLGKVQISLSLNGEVRQNSKLDAMIWSVTEIISELSKFYALQPGDLIFTGTPSGVAAVTPGDRLSAEISGIGNLDFEII